MNNPREAMKPEIALRRALESPRLALWGALAALMAIAWTYLVLAATAPPLAGGVAGANWVARLVALCSVAPASFGYGFAASLVMWAAMTLAMMLPAAVPMLASYLDIEQAARAKGMTIAPPAVLVAGYAAVWLGFAGLAAALQTTLALETMLTADAALAMPQLAGGILVLAGVYQFTPLKTACLVRCRRPMTVFMAAWRDDAAGVFALGARQGLFCVGCCWALMLAMFAVGVMNLGWMAVFAAVMVLEKTLGEPRPLVWGVGACLVAIGGAAMVL